MVARFQASAASGAVGGSSRKCRELALQQAASRGLPSPSAAPLRLPSWTSRFGIGVGYGVDGTPRMYQFGFHSSCTILHSCQ